MAGHSKRLKTTEVAAARSILAKKQGNVCPLCLSPMTGTKQPVLDHDHKTGYVRDALCRNCNSMEGKVFNLARRAKAGRTEVEWLTSLLEYYKRHETPQHGGVLHPTHRTEDEKRLLRNKRARAKRAAAKEAKK